MIYEDDIPVGHIQLDVVEDLIGYFSIVVKPELRGRGLSKRILHAFLGRPEVMRLNRLKADVEHDNVPAQRCLQAIGFIRESMHLDSEGFLGFTYGPKYKT